MMEKCNIMNMKLMNENTKVLTIYSKDYCPYCVMVKNLLVSLDIKYEEIDISKTPEIIMDLVKKS